MALHNLEFDYKPSERKYSTRCPKCADHRSKSGTKSLVVYNDDDGIRWQCFHPGCEWEKRMFRKAETNVRPNTNNEGADTDQLLCDMDDLPHTIDGDDVAYYRDADGRALFGVKRTDRQEGAKLFTPVVQVAGTLKYGKGAKYPPIKALYGAETIKDHDLVIVVEGEKARDAAAKIFTRAATVTWRGGVNNTSSGDWTLLDDKDVFLWPDADDSGVEAMQKIAGNLKGARRIRIGHVSHLPAKSDAADGLSRKDVGIVFDKSKDITNEVTGRLSFGELRAQNEKLNKRLPFGWPEVDSRVQLPQSGVVVVEARTKHGKTAFAVNLTRNMLYQGHTVQFFSYEIPASRVLARYGLSEDPTQTLDSVYDSKAIEPYQKWLNKELIIYDQSKQYSLNELVEALDKESNNGHCIVIDYCQIVPLEGSDRHLATKKLIDDIRVVAHKRGFLVLLLSQLTKNYVSPMQDSPRYAQDLHFGAEMVVRLWNKHHEVPHPLYDQTMGGYIAHIMYNRDGPSGTRFGFDLVRGTRLEPNGQADDEFTLAARRDSKSDIQQLADILRNGLGKF